MVKKPNFQDVLLLIQKQDVNYGFFFVTKFKMGFKHIFTRIFLITGLVLEFFFAITAFFGNDLLIKILELIILILYSSFVVSVIMLKVKNGDTDQMFNFCHKIYDIEHVFHEKVREIARKHVNIVYERSRKLIKYIIIFCYLDVAVIVPITFTIKHFLPDTISSKYSLPVPFTLFFFENQETPFAFYFTSVAQIIPTFQIGIGGSLLYSLIMGFILHVFAYLDIVIDIIDMMNQDIWKDHSKLTRNTEFDMTFWIKMIVDIVSNVHDAMQPFDNVFHGFFLLSEITAFGSLIAFGMVFLVLKQQYFLGIGISAVSMFFYIFCYVNEMLVTKLTNIRLKLYGIDWYNLTSKEMQLLLVTLNTDNLNISFSASGIHDLTLDRFASVVNGAYSNCLILKDILLK